MKLAFSTVGCPEWSLTEIIASARDLGYDGVEFRGLGRELYAPHVPEFSADKALEVKQRMQRLNLSIPCLASSCALYDKAAREKTITEAGEYAQTAQALGAPYIRLLGDAAPAPGEDIDDGFVAELLTECVKACGSTVPLIETNGVYADSERLYKLIRRCRGAGVLWDIHHPFRYKAEPVRTTYKTLAEYIRHVHIKDSIRQGIDVRYRIPGAGDVPIAECVRLLEGGGYDGFYCLEWVRRWDLTLEDAGIVFAQYTGYMKSL